MTLEAAMMIRRLVQLNLGLCLFGAALALMVRARLGLDPWNVFHQGLATHTGLTIGQVSILAGIVVMLLWIPLRQRPGIGTVCNVFVIGLTLDATLLVLPEIEGLALRSAFLVAGVVLNGLGCAAYIGAGLGTGPRDGLMTGLHQRFGWSIRVARLSIEIAVLALGWLLGGVAGVGTVLYALAIGPIVQFFLVRMTLPPRERRRRRIKQVG